MNADQWKRYEDDDRPSLAGPNSYSTKAGSAPESSGKPRPEFTLLVAGCRGGKTSFLRLLLDTSIISQTTSKEQLASVAKFVQGCSGHTSLIRTASVNVDIDTDGSGAQHHLGLTLVDTPSLDFKDEHSTERVLSEIMRHVEARFGEGIEDEWKAQSGDRYIHLCIYFLDPDLIVPPSVPGPPAPLIPRTRTNSFSQPEQEPVILEPPVTTNPLLYRAALPAADIAAIRRLSSRVNVLPVIARADVLSNDRLSAIKLAVRRDLAEAGIGFGIFDVEHQPQHQQHHNHSQDSSLKNGDSSKGYGVQPNGSSTTTNSHPASPVNSSFLRLPYALISPDIYSHSDGVSRIPLSRHELVLQYSPSSYNQPGTSRIVGGKFVRSYRWGHLDVLDSTHSDFMPLRAAIFHHNQTLREYTRDYLFDKFLQEWRENTRPTSRHSLTHHITQGLSQLGPISHTSRPVLAIDTATSRAATSRHPSLNVPREHPMGTDMRSVQPPPRHIPDTLSSSISGKGSGSSSRSTKQRTKKITVACNFCRSRKLKCDGGRPACSQCLKRSNPCDYQTQNKRRGSVRQRKGDDSLSDSGEERTLEHDLSLSPQVSSQDLSRRSSNVDGHGSHEGFSSSLPSMGGSNDPPSSSSRSIVSTSGGETRSFFVDNELPHIATLSLPEPSPSTPVPMSAPSLPPIRPASDLQAAQRKRASTVPGKTTRQPSTSGPKVVACNFCRARKTKCDGAHPACSSCARRNLPCNYVHDHANANGPPMRKGPRRSSTSKPIANSPASPPSSRMIPTPASADAGSDHMASDIRISSELDLKRSSDEPDARPMKKLRMDSPSAMLAGIP